MLLIEPAHYACSDDDGQVKRLQMYPIDQDWLLEKIALLAPLIASLTIHELAHARTALAFGDPTAKNMGRCTLNPLAHLDPIGTLSLIFFGFGWAKPVPVNIHNLHPRKWGSIAVSLAGPASNLMLAIMIGLVLRGLLSAGIKFSSQAGEVAFNALFYTMVINLLLFTFNMIPLFPLDGHHILREQLPGDMQAGFMRWQLQYGRYGLMLLIMGPMIARMFGQPIISPIGWLIGHLSHAAMIFIAPPV